MYELVEASLKYHGILEDYLQRFIENEVDDSVVFACLRDTTLVSLLESIIDITGRRIKFLKTFSELAAEKDEFNGKIKKPSAEKLSNRSPFPPITGAPNQLFPETTSPPRGKVTYSNASTKCCPSPQDCRHIGNDETPIPSPGTCVPHPVQIMNFEEAGEGDEKGGMQFYRQSLEKIVAKTGSRPVGVLAIAGPSRKGKSFFINFGLRYLEGRTEDEDDWMGWTRSKDPLIGFPWKSSKDRVTTGIWMWSDPITLKSKDGQEYDILLMDTQGVFDDYTTPHQWSILVGLGLLTSSCFIFNLASDLQEDQLNIFDTFLQFGLLALQDQDGVLSDDVETPFQKLVFLIRDWDNIQHYPLGSEGGKSFIQEKMQIKSHHQAEHRRVREQISQCFEEVTCHLLPHPGPKLREEDYSGALDRCQAFFSELESCIASIMDPEEFPVKKLRGNHLTGQDLLDQFTMFFSLFSNKEMPSSESFCNIFSKTCNSAVVNKCINAANEELQQALSSHPFLQETLLQQLRDTVEEKALQLFKLCKKMGKKESIEESKQDLVAKIEEIFEHTKAANEHRKVQTTLHAIDTAVSSYATEMEDFLSSDFFTSDSLDKVSSENEAKSMEIFKQLCFLEDPEELPVEAEKLASLLHKKVKHFQQTNDLKKLVAEKKLDAEVDKLADSYRHEMELKTDGSIISNQELAFLHIFTWQKCLHAFTNLNPHPMLYEKAQETLVQKVDMYQKDIQRSVKTSNDNIQLAGEQLKYSGLKTYQIGMRAFMGVPECDFQLSHNKMKDSVIHIAGTSERIKSKKCLQMFLQEMEAEIDASYRTLYEELVGYRQDLKTKNQKAQLDAINTYTDAMNKLFQGVAQNFPIEDPKLEYRHAYAKSKAMDFLQTHFNDVCENYRDDEEEAALLEELGHKITAKYNFFGEINQLRWEKFESETLNILSAVKDEYVATLKPAIDECFHEEEFLQMVEETQMACESKLRVRVDTNLAKPEFFESLQQKLRNHIQTQLEGFLELFRMKNLEDKMQVGAAFVEAKKFYNEEMGKLTEQKDWYAPEELRKISKEKTDIAVKRGIEEIELSPHQEKLLRQHIATLFFKYENANFLRYPRESYSVGIDLGTTYSCVAVYINKQVRVIESTDGGIVPSVVAFADNHEVLVGEAAKNQFHRYPENTIFDAKRLIGRKFTERVVQEDIKKWQFNVAGDVGGQPKIKVRGMKLRPEEISAKILARLRNLAEEYLHTPVVEAVVTVPAYFTDSQRQATRDAAQIAGLKVRILNEPTAAAVAYGLDTPDDIQRNVLIFDLGGGTFDVAVLQMRGGQIVVKAVGGDTHLGGSDFDDEMVEHVIKHVRAKDGIDLGRDRKSFDEFKRRQAFKRLGRIRLCCEKQKRELSSEKCTVISVDAVDENYDLAVTFTRELFEQLNIPRFKNCISLMADTLADSRLKKTDIDDIVLVGGSTKIPKIREMVREFFNGKQLNIRIKSEEAVARGAAIHAALINGKQAELTSKFSLSDVAPLSLGVEVVTGKLSVVIPKNTPVPCMRSENYRTSHANQTFADVWVYEGEKLMAVDNNFLGKFLLSNIPKAPAGREPIDINMRVDAEGILHVQATSRSSKSTNSIVIETYKGRMTSSEISTARRADLFKW